MDQDELARRLLATFQAEIPEHVGALNEHLLALERDPSGPGSAERVKSLFRAAHSLKGAARSVGLGPIEELCHHLEDVLRAVQGAALALGAEDFALLFAAADGLDDARQRLAAGHELSGGPLEVLAPQLAALAGRQARVLPLAPLARPAPAPSVSSSSVPVPSATAPTPTAPSATAPPPPSTSAATPAPAVEGMVRVAAVKLDALLSRSGELLVAERRLEQVEAGVAAIGELLGHLHREWRHRRTEVHLRRAGAARRPGRELAELEAHVTAARADLERLGATLRDDHRVIGRAVSQMDDEVRRILLLPFAEACQVLERAILEAAGYEVLTAVDGEQAFRLRQERGADLVVSDVAMPHMDGIALCQAIRASKRFRELPVVLVSGLESEQDKARGGEAGADAYLVKSAFDQRDLLSTLTGLLGSAP